MTGLLRWTMALLLGCVSTAGLSLSGSTDAVGVCRILFVIFAGLLALTAAGAIVGLGRRA